MHQSSTALSCVPTHIISLHCTLYAGLYLVSAGTDQLLVLWEVGLRKAVCKRTTPSTVSALSWHPKNNSLACISEEGSVAVWDYIVPDGHPGPHVSPDSLPAQGVTSPQEGGGERGGSVDPTGRGPMPVVGVWMRCQPDHLSLIIIQDLSCTSYTATDRHSDGTISVVYGVSVYASTSVTMPLRLSKYLHTCTAKRQLHLHRMHPLIKLCPVSR